jgi:hypothetical protein
MNEEFKCKRCNKDFENYDSLRRHTSKIHKIHGTKFYVEFYLNNLWPACKCGCGEKMLWSYKLKGFRSFKAGHQSRIHNNWGHNKKAIEASAETRRQQYKSGEREPWCKGLTKETDERIYNYGKKISEKFTKERKKKYSKKMAEMRKDGTIPTLYREQSSQWKGGVSSIQHIARSDKRLYESWKYPILERDGFKCKICKSDKDLHVHHNGESFSDILKKVMTIDDYEKIDDFEVKKAVVARVIDYHINSGVSGETLCKECHNNIHPFLNF